MKKLWLLSLLIICSCDEDEGTAPSDCKYVPETQATTNIAGIASRLMAR